MQRHLQLSFDFDRCTTCVSKSKQVGNMLQYYLSLLIHVFSVLAVPCTKPKIAYTTATLRMFMVLPATQLATTSTLVSRVGNKDHRRYCPLLSASIRLLCSLERMYRSTSQTAHNRVLVLQSC